MPTARVVPAVPPVSADLQPNLRQRAVASAADALAELARDGLRTSEVRHDRDERRYQLRAGQFSLDAKRKQADVEICGHVEQLKIAMLSTVQVTTIISEMRDAYTCRA